MEIIDLIQEYEETFCCCLEDWSEEMKEAGDLKKRWLETKKSQGLRVKLARNESGQILGMIQYIPIENAPVVGEDLMYIYCIWVHGYKEGVGNYQKKGIGKRLLKAAEEDSRALGTKGMAAWGITLPFWMRSKWFKKQGYIRADKNGVAELVWKPFSQAAVSPQFLKLKKRPTIEKGQVTLTCLRNGWCPAQNLSCERALKAAGEYQDKVKVVEVDTEIRRNLEEWGASDALFIDGKQINTGPPPTLKKLTKLLSASVKRIKSFSIISLSCS